MRPDGKRVLSRAILPLALLGLATLTACQSAPSRDATPNTPLFLRQVNVDQFDYDPLSSPDELTKKASLVIRGQLSDIVAGRVFLEPGTKESNIVSGVYKIEVGEVLRGQLAGPSDGIVYVEQIGIQNPEEISATAPKGADVLLYLVTAPSESLVPGTEVLDDGAGFPPDQPLYQTANPQGFYLDTGADVTQVVGNEVYRNSDLSQFEPGHDKFPSDPVTTE